MSSSQAYRDSDEMAAALAYLIPTWCYSRIANPSTYYYEWTLALLEGYGFDGETSCCSTSSGMAAIMTAVQPFLVHTRHDTLRAAQLRRHGPVLRRHLPAVQRPPAWRSATSSAAGSRTRRTSTSGRRRSTRTRASSTASCRAIRGQGFFDIQAVADLAHSHNLPLICDSTVATPALLRPICHGADIVVQSVTKTLTSSGFGICGAVIARKGLVTNIANDALKNDFALYVKYLPNRDYGPNLHPMQAIMTLNDMRTLRSKIDLMSRNTMKVAAVPRDATRASRACSTSACRTIRCTSWPAATCGSSTPSTTSSTASR